MTSAICNECNDKNNIVVVQLEDPGKCIREEKFKSLAKEKENEEM